jgi:hypothetical protein
LVVGLVVLAAAGCRARRPATEEAASVPSAEERPPWPTFDGRPATARTTAARTNIALEGGAVALQDATGKQIWSTPLTGRLGSVRPPDRVASTERVVVAVDNALVALERATGKEVWRRDGPVDRLLIAGDVVVATECGSHAPTSKRWLVGRKLLNGDEAFRVEIPANADPRPMERIGDLFVLGDAGFTYFIDLAGAARIKLDEELVTTFPLGGDWLVVTTGRIARLDGSGKTLWEGKPVANRSVAAAGVVPLAGGDLVVFDYGAISDSGVEVVRLEPNSGRELYRVTCPPLGVAHSKYSHTAHVRLTGDRIQVVSHGSGGSFVEEIAPSTGKSERRTAHSTP